MINGVLVINKPQNFTSFDVCAKLRGMLRTKKIGHAGTLDPMATGVLPVLVGNATRAAELFPVHDKTYIAAFRLGITTDTLDIWGQVSSESTVNVCKEEIEAALSHFRGEIMQTPPMYSAVSVGGKRLYDLARSGIEVERPQRQVTVYALELLSYDPKQHEGTLVCSCSKGTYIRTLIDDLGRQLGCGAAMTALERTAACGYELRDALTLEQVQQLCDEGSVESAVLPVSTVFSSLTAVNVSPAQAVRVRNGGALSLERLGHFGRNAQDGQQVRIEHQGEFLALGEVSTANGELRIKKLFCQNNQE